MNQSFLGCCCRPSCLICNVIIKLSTFRRWRLWSERSSTLIKPSLVYLSISACVMAQYPCAFVCCLATRAAWSEQDEGTSFISERYGDTDQWAYRTPLEWYSCTERWRACNGRQAQAVHDVWSSPRHHHRWGHVESGINNSETNKHEIHHLCTSLTS